ncbi:MAG: hypothetical protein Q7S79_01155 [bacterium]|nr:hypothetical protein [bacterium]
MTERPIDQFDQLTTERRNLVYLQIQQETLNEDIKQQEKRLREVKAKIIGVGPDTIAAHYSDSILDFAAEHFLDVQWLANRFLSDTYDVKKSSLNYKFSAASTDFTHMEHYEYALDMIRKSNGNVYSGYHIRAMESLIEAQRISEEREKEVLEIPEQRMSAYYKFLQEHIGTLLEVRQKYYQENY